MSQSTVGEYERTSSRVLCREIPTVPKCKSSSRVERAALRWHQLKGVAQCKDVEEFLRTCDHEGWDAGGLIQSVLTNRWSYSEIPQLDCSTPCGRHERNSKRKILGQLPPDWRQQFVDGSQSTIPGMDSAFLLMAITGCRPAEISSISFAISEDRMLAVHIVSVKRRAHQIGDWRSMRLPLPDIYGDCKALFDPAAQAQLRQITAKQIIDAARKISKRVFPHLGEKVTVSTLRHQFASDLKACGVTKREVAMALGHSLQTSQNAYGRPRHGFVEHIKIEINANYEPSSPRSERARTFLDIAIGHEFPEP